MLDGKSDCEHETSKEMARSLRDDVSEIMTRGNNQQPRHYPSSGGFQTHHALTCAAAARPLASALSAVDPRQKSPHATSRSSDDARDGLSSGRRTKPEPHLCTAEKAGGGHASAPIACIALTK